MARVKGLRRRGGATPAVSAAPPKSLDGVVETFSRKLVQGWVSVPADAPPVRVDLMVGKRAPRLDVRHPGLADVREPAPQRPRGQDLLVPDPRDLALRQRATRITVRVDGRPLPIHRHGMYLSPPATGRFRRRASRQVDQGFVLTQRGTSSCPRRWTPPGRTRSWGSTGVPRGPARRASAYEAFFIYGTLLGAVREGGYIGHESTSTRRYISERTDPARPPRELQRDRADADRARARGQARTGPRCTSGPGRPRRTGSTCSTCYFDDAGLLRFPFGVAGRRHRHHDDWKGATTVEFPGGTASCRSTPSSWSSTSTARTGANQAGLQLGPRPDRLRAPRPAEHRAARPRSTGRASTRATEYTSRIDVLRVRQRPAGHPQTHHGHRLRRRPRLVRVRRRRAHVLGVDQSPSASSMPPDRRRSSASPTGSRSGSATWPTSMTWRGRSTSSRTARAAR